MAFVFQSIFSWAAPLMDGIDALFGVLGGWATEFSSRGCALQSMVVDGVIAGVGGVVIFFAPNMHFVSLYCHSRRLWLFGPCSAADGPVVNAVWVIGQVIYSVACRVLPVRFQGVMATRTIDDSKDRIATMLVAPLMSCSARLPVYAIFIGAFIPAQTVWGWIGLQGLTLFALYCVGIFVAIPVAWILKKTLLKGQPAPFVLEMPSYKIPDVGTVGMRIYQSASAFCRKGRYIDSRRDDCDVGAGVFPAV